MAGVRVGGGKYSLRFTKLDAEQSVQDLSSAAGNPTATSVESPVWFIEPSVGMRSRFNQFIVLEARIGYGISMSNGEWKFNGKVIDTANVKLGGPSLNVGIKLGTF
jgi:hypothetical protein